MQIYQTINTINSKFYIGQDSYDNPEYLGSGKILKQAIKKYGKGNFIKIILEDNIRSKEELNSREIYWIEKLDAINKGYNIAKGGSGGDTISNHPNYDAIMVKNRKRYESLEYKTLMSSVTKKSASQRKALSAARKKNWQDPLYRMLISNSRKLTHNTPEFKKQNRERQLGILGPTWKGYIFLYDSEGNLKHEFNSRKEAIDAGIPEGTINRHLNHNSTPNRGRFKGYKFIRSVTNNGQPLTP
jgi:group I intron endonuclease